MKDKNNNQYDADENDDTDYNITDQFQNFWD